MTPTEFEASWRHLVRYPPAEQILASLGFTVAKALGAKDVELSHYGYWLESPEMRREREQREEDMRQAQMTKIVSEAYQRSKTDG